MGLIRFVLSILVVIAHLTEGLTYLSHCGVYAVFGFYVASGYLITYILRDVYAFQTKRFWVNRLLRLYPIYYFVLMVTLLVIWIYPESSLYHAAWNMRVTEVDVIGNLLIFPMEFYKANIRIVPPAWSVAVEIINYFLIFVFIGRGRNKALMALFVAIIYHVVSFVVGMGWKARYGPFYAALLPFSLGSLIYYLKDNLILALQRRKIFVLSSLLWCINIIISGVFGGIEFKKFEILFYLNLIFIVGTICGVVLWDFNNSRCDRRLGNLSYPIFLIHWLVGFLVAKIVCPGQWRGLKVLFMSLPITIVISIFMAQVTDKIIEPLRAKIRPTSRYM